MLKQRVVTAIVLLLILLPSIFAAPAWVWGGVSLAFLALAAREWVRLLPSGAGPPRASRGWLLAVIMLLAGLATLAFRQQTDWPAGWLDAAMGALGAFWLVVGSLRLRSHRAQAGGQLLVGLLLFGCWLALYELRLLGTVLLLSSMAVIWIADIAAYFAGRAFGRHKLAPAISPGKSWEGAVAGLAAVVLIGWLVAAVASADGGLLAQALPALLVRAQGPVVAGLVLAGLAALSIVGDLHESLLKRQAGVKDSGAILPGHGGVLDRIDALIPTMPVALLVARVLG